MRINNNTVALQTLNNLQRRGNYIQKSSEKLSSGVRINSAKDDAAGMAIANKMINQVRGSEMADRNSLDGISLLQTAEGALGEITNILQRLRELAVQSANDVLTAEDRGNIQFEVDSLVDEIDQLSRRTEFNNIKLLFGEASVFGYTNNPDLASIEQISDYAKSGILSFDLSKVGVPAKITSSGISGGIGGNLYINGTEINISASDSASDIVQKIKNAVNSIGIHVLEDGSNLHLVTNQTGSGASIAITMDNPMLANSLGFLEGTIKGIDAEINNPEFYNSQNKFDADYTSNFNIVADGNKITFKNGVDIININIKTKLLPNGDIVIADGTAVTDAGIISGSINLSMEIFESPLTLQIGQNKDMEMNITIPKITADNIGLGDLIMTTSEDSRNSLVKLDSAISYISALRASLGADQNRLEFVSSTLALSSDTTSNALSRIRDTNMAKEMTNYTQSNVISQAAMSILAQANQRPQQILQLLQ